TQFAFEPIYTTTEMREMPHIVEKVENINKIRNKRSAELTARGEAALDPYTFDYLLLCNKICGSSHYNMQVKVVVDTPADFNNWLIKQGTLVKKIQSANAQPEEVVPGAAVTDSLGSGEAPSVAVN
ncbi:MAG: cytochrome c oxidase subunit II, partial [Flavobacterium sp.]|nr:cytochrome c oxidase subunit II [Flavobacterium sp.]